MGNFVLPVVRKTKDNTIQGQWDAVDLNAFGDSASFAVLLGYLANIFAKVCHPGPPEIVRRDIVNFSGSNICHLEEAGRHFQLSRVEVNIVELPNSANVRFGQPDMVKIGVCAFGRSTEARQDEDWEEVKPERTSQTMGAFIALAAGAAFPKESKPFSDLGYGNIVPNNGSPGATTGAQTTFVKGIHTVAPNSTFIAPPDVVAAVGAMVFGGGAPQTNKNNVLKGQIPQRHWYPVEAISFQESVFRPVDPNCTEFYINLDTGVVVNIVLYGTEVAPGIDYTGDSEQGGGGSFNPMNGGFHP